MQETLKYLYLHLYGCFFDRFEEVEWVHDNEQERLQGNTHCPQTFEGLKIPNSLPHIERFCFLHTFYLLNELFLLFSLVSIGNLICIGDFKSQSKSACFHLLLM